MPFLFQSLFSWNLLSIYECLARQRCQRCCFNPCFRGTCSRSAVWLILPSPQQSVSILVFVELALDRLDFARAHPPGAGFQSLFSWNLLSISPSVLTAEPYFTAFQSLFSWNLLSIHNMVCRGPLRHLEFQSLFSWNLLSIMSIRFRIALQSLCFNPCFRGTCSRSLLLLCLVYQ